MIAVRGKVWTREKIIAGVSVLDGVLSGQVLEVAPTVQDLAVGDEVLFPRPAAEGALPQYAFMDADLVFAKVVREAYG